MKRFITHIPFLVLLIIAIVSLSFSETERGKLTCKNVIVTIDNNKLTQDYLTENEIFKNIKKDKKSIIGKKISSINSNGIEEAIENISSVLKCECYFTIDGTLKIDINIRIPVIRIIGLHDNYYIDQYGRLMPLSNNHSVRTLIASGNIPDGFRKKHNVMVSDTDSSDLQALYLISMTIREDEFLNSLIEQIYVSKPNHYTLISKVGPVFIEFGNIENYEQKLITLKSFYKSDKARENWHLYKMISVKYNNQIVCTKI